MKELVVSIRNYNNYNYKEIINNIKKVGFQNVFIEWYNNDLSLQENILNYTKEVGLNIVFAHLGYQNVSALWLDTKDGDYEEKRYIDDLKKCKENGINLVVMHPTLEYENYGMNEIGLTRIKRIIDYAKELDMKVAFENVELVKYLEYIIKNINSSNLGVCFDVGHCHLFNNGEFNIKLFDNKVYTIHLHDNFKEKDEHNLPFDGTVNWDRAIKQIITMHYDGYIVIESGYNNYYTNFDLEGYYRLAYDRGMQLKKLFELYKNNK